MPLWYSFENTQHSWEFELFFAKVQLQYVLSTCIHWSQLISIIHLDPTKIDRFAFHVIHPEWVEKSTVKIWVSIISFTHELWLFWNSMPAKSHSMMDFEGNSKEWRVRAFVVVLVFPDFVHLLCSAINNFNHFCYCCFFFLLLVLKSLSPLDVYIDSIDKRRIQIQNRQFDIMLIGSKNRT